MKKKEWLEEEILKYIKDRMVKVMTEVEDPHLMDMEDIEDFCGADVRREPHGLDPPEPDPNAHTRQSCGHSENGWIKSQFQACLRV